jgi:uncharacterized protein (TIGR03437 family)
MRRFRVVVLLFCCSAAILARREPQLCGTDAETANERLFLHRQAAKARKGLRPLAAATASRNRDIGNLAIVEDVDGIVARQNEFNLDGKTLRFTPSAAGYRYAVVDGGYEASAAAAGAPVVALDDDDSRPVALPFAFPFYGATYRELHLNSDGNLTFTANDTASTNRSLGRMTAGPPRISALFDDLDPARTAGGVRVLSESGRVVVSWVAVPEWVSAGIGRAQTFQAKLYDDGRIEFSYAGVQPGSAVVGIAPGSLEGGTAVVDYRDDASAAYAGAVAERFGSTLEIDIVTLAQRFYETHEDAYDYLVIYNNMDIPALGLGVIAYENTVRSHGLGYGVEPRDDGAHYGSPSRLQAILNMGQLSQFPKDPNALVPGRAAAGDTPMTVLGHEAGHLFLAYASVNDPDDPANRPMLGFQNQHWGFYFNSEASLLEGERILDNGPGVSPRFVTVATAEGFSPLDQYLMGWRAPADVPDTFVVTGGPAFLRNIQPVRGVSFDGQRRDISAAEVARAMGRRTPDHTIGQRRYRFAFILLTAPGADPSAADLAQVEQYRSLFEPFFAKAATDRAFADTSLRRSLKLSLSPAAGVVAGTTATATLTVATPPGADLTVTLATSNGSATLPPSVTIPAGGTTVSFSYSGDVAGVQEVTATPSDSAYETAYARLQVAGAAELKLTEVSSDPLVVRLADANGLTYPGARIVASASSGGTVTPAIGVTDAQGLATFRWTPGPGATNQLQLSVESVPGASLTLRAGSAVPAIAAVVNAASYAPGVAAGALQTIFGANLAGAAVSLDGNPLPVSYTDAAQINFYVPPSTPTGPATLVVSAPSGERAARPVDIVSVLPGIFAVRPAGDGYLEIYCTGLGPLRAGGLGTTITPVVFIGAAPVQPLYSGLAPGVPGLYQINVRIPAGAAGPHTVMLSVNLAHSNQVVIP